jgi:hypothetical protein
VSNPGGGFSEDPPEQSFADVLNSLSSGPRWSSADDASSAEQPAEQTLSLPWLARASRSDSDEEMGTAQARWAAVAEEWGEPQDFGSSVRPYSWTKGRTRPVYDLEVETLVSTTEQGCNVATLTSIEHRSVAELCRRPRSVAEVGALLSLPLGVARVLLGDMADIGLVMVHRAANETGERPDLAFMERVLSGLRRL